LSLQVVGLGTEACAFTADFIEFDPKLTLRIEEGLKQEEVSECTPDSQGYDSSQDVGRDNLPGHDGSLFGAGFKFGLSGHRCQSLLEDTS
jgi:hypothetical protein